jgi:hypothetical protein
MTTSDGQEIERKGAGVLFVATGAAHVGAARAAAASVRATNPWLNIALFSEQAAPGPEFDLVVPVDAPRARSKVDAMWRTPFERTLYLDNDTRVRADLADLFRVIERFDLGAARVVHAYKKQYRRKWRADVPDAFPSHDSGVILYRATPAVIAFFQAWQQAFDAAGFSVDQVTFRDLLWSSDLRLCTLPPQYNHRRFDPLAWARGTGPEPVILHMNRFNPMKRRLRHRFLDPVLGT